VIIAATDTGLTEGNARQFRDPYSRGNGRSVLVCHEMGANAFGHGGLRSCTLMCGLDGHPLVADSVYRNPEIQAMFLVSHKVPVVEVRVREQSEHKPVLTKTWFVSRDGTLWLHSEPIEKNLEFFDQAIKTALVKLEHPVLESPLYVDFRRAKAA
jgi:hypothetical protein